MTKQLILALLMFSVNSTAQASPVENSCTCNCREKKGSCPESSKFDFRHPERSVTFGVGMLEGKDPGRLVIRRTEPLSLRYEHRFADWFYLYVTFKTELTDLTYYNHIDLGDAVEVENSQKLDLQVGLKSRWNRIGGAGMRFVPYESNRLMLDLSIGFEEMALSDMKIEDVYFINPLLSFELGDMIRDHARIRYNWRKLDFETRLNWTPPQFNERFTPHLNLGIMLAKSDIEIWYDEEIADRISDSGAITGIVPEIPNHGTFYVFAPSVGAGLEFRITDHIAVDVSGSMLPFGDRTVRIGTFGLILRQ